MKIAAKLLLCLIAFAPSAFAQGKIETIKDVKSEYIKYRDIQVWTPEQYHNDKAEKYAVLYMHDGQNVFNDGDASDGMSWHAAETAQKLIDDGAVEPFIIVAISNSPERFYEFFPQKAAEYLDSNDLEQIEKITNSRQHAFAGDAYLKFMVEELKPYIDKNYRTKSEATDTSVMGASMGGLISLYAICEYPDVFGQAACVSTHWPVTGDYGGQNASDAVRKYLESNVPTPQDHRLYFDYGTEGPDAYYEEHQNQVDNFIKQKGYVQGENWLTKKYTDAAHNEKSWSARFDQILLFLYKK